MRPVAATRRGREFPFLLLATQGRTRTSNPDLISLFYHYTTIPTRQNPEKIKYINYQTSVILN